MSEDSKSPLRAYVGFSRLMLILSSAMIVLTVIPSILSVDKYAEMCICTINYLAYAWIAFAINILLALIAGITAVRVAACETGCTRRCWPNLLLWLQGAAFLCGIIMLVVFITRFTSVL